MKYLGIVLVSLCLASPVSAGCAWILWEYKTENLIIGGGQWRTIGQWYEPLASFEKLSECKERNANISNLPSDMQGETLPNGNRLMYEFHCLPDTVDPRGPQGK